jgi:hypothetical protein
MFCFSFDDASKLVDLVVTPVALLVAAPIVAESFGIGPSLGGGDDEDVVVLLIKTDIDGVAILLEEFKLFTINSLSFLSALTDEEFVNLVLFKLFTFELDSFKFLMVLFAVFENLLEN